MTETLLQGDCLKLMSKLPDKAVDLVVTDPPYDVGAGKSGGVFGNRNFYKEIEFMSNGFNETVLDELMRVMKKTNIYIFCSQKQIPFLIDYFVHKHTCNWNLLTWHKTNPIPACKKQILERYRIYLFCKGKRRAYLWRVFNKENLLCNSIKYKRKETI